MELTPLRLLGRQFCGIAALAASFIGTTSHTARAEDLDERPLVSVAKLIAREGLDYGYQRWLSDSLPDEEVDACYGLKLETGWQEIAAADPRRPLVVLVHGFNSTCERNAAILEPIRQAGFACASFSYPNDCSLPEAAALMSKELKAFAAEHPEQSIALVTHSMGGLVARECLENAELDPGVVTRLVMIAPPSQGTLIANFAAGADLWEHLLGRTDGGLWTRCRDSITDGLGEAADDLVPGSPFLTTLNARPRNPRVRYSIFLGTDAGVAPWERDLVRLAVQHAGSRYGRLERPADTLDQVLAEMDELVDGQGDGVVAVERGRLAGVDDVVVLPFGHVNCTGPADCDAVRQLQANVLARLQ